jgi:capsular exopolysaccharide synthesis family protein
MIKFFKSLLPAKKAAAPDDAKRSKKLLVFNKSQNTNEAFKHLRTLLSNTTKQEHCPVFAMVTPKAKGGNATVSSNLAISFAQLGKKVLLIDGNMRKPKIASLFALNAERGLSELLSLSEDGVLDLSGTVIPSGIENLDIITSGAIPENPAELLASAAFSSLLENAKNEYEYIFICLPPVCDVADACIVAENVFGYIFTVRSEKTDGRYARRAIDSIKSNGGVILGTVLNDVSPFVSAFLNK